MRRKKEKVIKQLKKKKAVGREKIIAELIKEGGEELQKIIFRYILRTWRTRNRERRCCTL